MYCLEFGWISHFLMQCLAKKRPHFSCRTLCDPQKMDEFGD